VVAEVHGGPEGDEGWETAVVVLLEDFLVVDRQVRGFEYYAGSV